MSMKRTALVLSPLALAFLAGCVSDPVTPAPVVITPAPTVVAAPPQVVAAPAGTVAVVPAAPAVPAVVATPPLRTGMGRIDSITAISPSAAAGGSASSHNRRVGIKMDDGTLQYVDTAALGLTVNERVELTAHGNLRRPVP